MVCRHPHQPVCVKIPRLPFSCLGPESLALYCFPATLQGPSRQHAAARLALQLSAKPAHLLSQPATASVRIPLSGVWLDFSGHLPFLAPLLLAGTASWEDCLRAAALQAS